MVEPMTDMLRGLPEEGEEEEEEESRSGIDTDVMTMCGTPKSWCRTWMACLREAKSEIFTPERSLCRVRGFINHCAAYNDRR